MEDSHYFGDKLGSFVLVFSEGPPRAPWRPVPGAASRDCPRSALSSPRAFAAFCLDLIFRASGRAPCAASSPRLALCVGYFSQIMSRMDATQKSAAPEAFGGARDRLKKIF